MFTKHLGEVLGIKAGILCPGELRNPLNYFPVQSIGRLSSPVAVGQGRSAFLPISSEQPSQMS